MAKNFNYAPAIIPEHRNMVPRTSWRQHRQRALTVPGRQLGGLLQAIEKRGAIRIPRIDLVPDAGNLAGIEPGGNQRSLARTGRADYADCGPVLAGIVQSGKQPLPGDGFVQPRPSQFG